LEVSYVWIFQKKPETFEPSEIYINAIKKFHDAEKSYEEDEKQTNALIDNFCSSKVISFKKEMLVILNLKKRL
jgi:hypothetical protein